MKNTFLAIIFTIITISSFAQNIEGIGDFKIGMTYEAHSNWLKENNIIVEEVATNFEAYSMQEIKKLQAYTLIYDESKPYDLPDDMNYVNGFKIIILNNYNPSDINIKKLKFTFKNNILIGLHTSFSEELELAFNAKYGMPKSKITKKLINCRFNFTGAINTKAEEIRSLSWRNDNIYAHGQDSFEYDSQCTMANIRLFEIYNKKEYLEYSIQNLRAQKDFKFKINNKKNENLKKTLDKL